MSDGRDYPFLGLHPFAPVDAATRQQYDVLIALCECYQVRQTISTKDARHTYALLLDKAGRWGLEDGSPIVAVHVLRNSVAGTFRIDRAELPTLPAAQDWFEQREMGNHRILSDSYGRRPADGLTEAIDRESGRYHREYDLTKDTLTGPDPSDSYFLFEPSGAATTEVHWLIRRSELGDGIFRLRDSLLPSALATHHWLTDHGITRKSAQRPRARLATAPSPPQSTARRTTARR
ncbi:hypothetical protein ACFWBX_11875 [Streptomyces sp. NPDC059991]|uniref:hypothetical protein n=1 Tax=Streptomyces sp. NPDC059991 TaxID=3347028 RepID=UPI0036BAAA07